MRYLTSRSGTQRRKPQLRRQPRPGTANRELPFGKRKACCFGETERLACHAGLAVMQDPHDRRSLAPDGRYRNTETQREHEPGLGKPGRDGKQIRVREIG